MKFILFFFFYCPLKPFIHQCFIGLFFNPPFFPPITDDVTITKFKAAHSLSIAKSAKKKISLRSDINDGKQPKSNFWSVNTYKRVITTFAQNHLYAI